MKTYEAPHITAQYKLFTKIYTSYDYEDFYFDDQNDKFVSKFIGKDDDAVTLTLLYKKFVKNYSIHLSMNKSILNINNMKVDDNVSIKGSEVNKLLDTLDAYLKNIQLNIN